MNQIIKKKLLLNNGFDIPDGHARAHRRADETQADHARETKEAPRTAATCFQSFATPWIFSPVICCTTLLVRLYRAIDHSTISTLYLIIIKYYHPSTLPAAYSLFLILLYKNLSKLIAATAILAYRLDVATITEFLGYFLILFYKPCDVYTIAVIVSFLVMLFIVSLRLIFNVLLCLLSFSL